MLYAAYSIMALVDAACCDGVAVVAHNTPPQAQHHSPISRMLLGCDAAIPPP